MFEELIFARDDPDIFILEVDNLNLLWTLILNCNYSIRDHDKFRLNFVGFVLPKNLSFHSHVNKLVHIVFDYEDDRVVIG